MQNNTSLNIVWSSSCRQDMHDSCLDGPYKLSITCQRHNSRVPSADEIRMLIYMSYDK